MGGRKSYGSEVVLGESGSVNKEKDRLRSEAESGNDKEVSLQVLNLLISSDQTIKTIILTMKILALAYEIYCRTEEEYSKSGDYTVALCNAFFKTIGNKIEGSKQIIIEEGVKICWNLVAEKNNVQTRNEYSDLIISSTISELFVESLQ